MAQQSVAQALSLSRPRHKKSWDKSQLELPVFVIPLNKRPRKNMSEALSSEMELHAKDTNGTTSKRGGNIGGERRAGDLVGGDSEIIIDAGDQRADNGAGARNIPKDTSEGDANMGRGGRAGELVGGDSEIIVDAGDQRADNGADSDARNIPKDTSKDDANMGKGGRAGDLVGGDSGGGRGDTGESESNSGDSDDDGDKETGEIPPNTLGYTLGEEPLSSGFYWDHSYQVKVTRKITSTVSLDRRLALVTHQGPYIQFLQHKKEIKRRNKEKKAKKILHKSPKILMSRFAEADRKYAEKDEEKGE